jgi:hypothetical protein
MILCAVLPKKALLKLLSYTIPVHRLKEPHLYSYSVYRFEYIP